MRFKFAAAFILSLLLLAASKVRAGDERMDLAPRVQVIVFSTTPNGEWHSRISVTHEFSDALIFCCFEFPKQLTVQCIVIEKATGDVLMLPLSLLEIKT